MGSKRGDTAWAPKVWTKKVNWPKRSWGRHGVSVVKGGKGGGVNLILNIYIYVCVCEDTFIYKLYIYIYWTIFYHISDPLWPPLHSENTNAIFSLTRRLGRIQLLSTYAISNPLVPGNSVCQVAKLEIPQSKLRSGDCYNYITYAYTIHVWYIYLHLVDFYGKCRQMWHTWMVWVRELPFFKSKRCPFKATRSWFLPARHCRYLMGCENQTTVMRCNSKKYILYTVCIYNTIAPAWKSPTPGVPVKCISF